tara:strand:+ start:7578 stop:7991 length:414 start_codon:yes stop_codon:yes gene_type:complete
VSFTSLKWASEQNTGNSTSKLCLMMLANYADESNSCFPSQDHLAGLCHCSRRTINTYIKQLEKKKFITIIKSSNGLKINNRYTLNIPNEKILHNGISNEKETTIQCANIAQYTNIKKPKPTREFRVKGKKNRNFLAG